MAIRSDEIISIIRSAIDSFDEATETRSVGTVVEVGDGIAQIYGLEGALSSELLEFPGGVTGMALSALDLGYQVVRVLAVRRVARGDQNDSGKELPVAVGHP